MNSIITFYSFKGGVGRSMALANIGYLLATQMGKHVLAVDWDLEAPGLEKYFAGCPGASIQNAGRGGLIELLTDASHENKPNWQDYVSTVTIGEHRIDLITSGRRDAGYPAKVLGFDWKVFFEKEEGGVFIESLRDAWHQEYEIALIDSRTGFTDSGGVCTVQLPDILVPVFTTTEESAKGVVDVVERAQRARQKLAYDRSRLLVFPLPSRYDGRTQYQEAKTWLNLFAKWFGPYYVDWLPKSITPLQVIERTKLPYIGYFSFGTQMPAAIEGTSDPESLGFAYNVAATIIANEFQQVERLIAAIPDSPDQPSRAELALFRMRRTLQEKKLEWRAIGVLATAAGIGEAEALDVLRGEPEVDFGRAKSGRVIVRLRDPSRNYASSVEKFIAQREEARARFDRINPLKDKHCAGYFESSFFPDRFEKSQFALEALYAAIRRGDLAGSPFFTAEPDLNYAIEDGFEHFLNAKGLGGDDILDFWRLYQSGLLYYRSAMVRPSMRAADGEEICVLDPREAAIHIAMAINFLTRLYDGLLSTDGEVSFVLVVLGTENRVLRTPEPISMVTADYICRIPEITVERKLSLAKWRDKAVDHAVEMAKEVYLRFNWFSPDLEAARSAILTLAKP